MSDQTLIGLVGCFLAAWVLTRSLVFASMAAALSQIVPRLWSAHVRRQERLLLARQLRQSLQILVYALEAGASFQQALERVADEEEEPLKREWQRVCQDIQLGTPLAQVFGAFAERVPLRETRWLGTLVQITQQTGGSMGPLLGTFSATLMQKELLREKISALTAQGRASGYLLCALPVVMLAALGVMTPDLIQPLFNTTDGHLMLALASTLIGIGFLLIQKLVQVDLG